MRKMKKFFALMLAMIMAMAMTVTAFAQTVSPTTTSSDGASITVNNASNGAVYKVYKLFNATYDAATLVNGRPTKDSAVAYTYDGELPSLFTEAGFAQDPKTGAITHDGDVTPEQMDKLKEWAKDATPVVTATSDGTKLEFTGLAYGYYLVTSSLDNGAAIALDTTTPAVVMNDKNVSTPHWPEKDGKVGEDSTLSFGETTTFTLTLDTLNYAKDPEDKENPEEYKQIKDYIIDDNLANDKFDQVVITEVKVVNGNETKYLYSTDSTKTTVNPGTVQFTNNAFPIKVSWVNGSESLYASNSQLVVKYTARLKEDAVIGDGKDANGDNKGNKNEATYKYTFVGKDTPYDPDDPTEFSVFTYALAIKKVDGSDNRALSGAEFKIKNPEGEYIKFKEENGCYVYTGVAENKDSATAVRSNSNGFIVIKGVKEGAYTVEETKAPAGYNLLTVPQTVTAAQETATYYTVKNGEVVSSSTTSNEGAIQAATIEVRNNKGSVLPSTGGIGTTIFYVVGSLLIIGAGIVLVARKRMDKVSR